MLDINSAPPSIPPRPFIMHHASMRPCDHSDQPACLCAECSAPIGTIRRRQPCCLSWYAWMRSGFIGNLRQQAQFASISTRVKQSYGIIAHCASDSGMTGMHAEILFDGNHRPTFDHYQYAAHAQTDRTQQLLGACRYSSRARKSPSHFVLTYSFLSSLL